MVLTCMECKVDLIDVEVALRPNLIDQISVRKRVGEGLFDVVSATPSGGLCPVCGRLTLYVSNPGQFTGKAEK